MSNSKTSLKRHNHRIHPCKNEKKEELLHLLLTKNSDKKIIVATAQKKELSTEQKNVSILSDNELSNSPDAKCDMLISYDLPLKAIEYMARLSHTTTYALILVNSSEEKIIHPIETLLGRTIMQEFIEGFSEPKIQKQAQPIKKDANPREERKREFLDRDNKPKKPKYDKDKKSYDKKAKRDHSNDSEKKSWESKPKKDYSNDKDKKPWDKKKKPESKYLGKDENGKAIFSGKSSEKNNRYDGAAKDNTPKLTGKKISIKGVKKS